MNNTLGNMRAGGLQGQYMGGGMGPRPQPVGNMADMNMDEIRRDGGQRCPTCGAPKGGGGGGMKPPGGGRRPTPPGWRPTPDMTTMPIRQPDRWYNNI